MKEDCVTFLAQGERVPGEKTREVSAVSSRLQGFGVKFRVWIYNKCEDTRSVGAHRFRHISTVATLVRFKEQMGGSLQLN